MRLKHYIILSTLAVTLVGSFFLIKKHQVENEYNLLLNEIKEVQEGTLDFSNTTLLKTNMNFTRDYTQNSSRFIYCLSQVFNHDEKALAELESLCDKDFFESSIKSIYDDLENSGRAPSNANERTIKTIVSRDDESGELYTTSIEIETVSNYNGSMDFTSTVVIKFNRDGKIYYYNKIGHQA